MSAELAIQDVIHDHLKAQNVAGGKVYDRVERGTPLPYVHIRSLQAVDDGADCVDGIEVFADLDVWSDKPGKPEASTIAGAVRQALHQAPLTLSEPYALLEIEHQDTVIETSDGLLTRARMTFRALVERTT